MTFDGTINLPTLVTIIIAVIGTVAWLVRLEAKVQQASDLAKKVDVMHGLIILQDKQLADYKTHVAESFVTKQGMSEQTDRIMQAIGDVGSRVDGLGARLDRIVDNQPARTARRTSS